MKCIICGGRTKVIDKREYGSGNRRRRECVKCMQRFSTFESLKKFR